MATLLEASPTKPDNVPGLLLTLTDRGIIPPHDRTLWPAQEYLLAHRREWRL